MRRYFRANDAAMMMRGYRAFLVLSPMLSPGDKLPTGQHDIISLRPHDIFVPDENFSPKAAFLRIAECDFLDFTDMAALS